jgi:hypothetical protein
MLMVLDKRVTILSRSFQSLSYRAAWFFHMPFLHGDFGRLSPQTSHALLCRALARETLWGMAGPRACDKIKSPSHISMTLIGYRPEALPW